MAVAFFDFGEGGVKFGVGVAHLVFFAGLAVSEVVVEGFVVDTECFGGFGYAVEGLPSGFEEDFDFFGFAF